MSNTKVTKTKAEADAAAKVKAAADKIKAESDAKVAEEAEKDVVQTTDKAVAPVRSREQSRKRIPLGTRNVLTAPKNPGFVRRFVNDTGDRIQTFKDAGWKVVENTAVGDDKAGKASSMGSGANPSVGGGQRAVLMELPDKYYKEDEKAKQDAISKVENEIKRNAGSPGNDGLAGNVSIS